MKAAAGLPDFENTAPQAIRSLKIKIALTLFFCVICIGVIGEGVLLTARNISLTTQKLNDSNIFLTRLRDTVLAVKEAENLQKRFIILANPNSKKDLSAALLAVDKRVADLKPASDASGYSEEKARQLRRLIQDRIQTIRHSVVLRQQNGFAASKAVVESGAGREQSLQIVRMANEWREWEIDRLQNILMQAHALANKQVYIVASAGILILIVVIISSIFIWRTYQRIMAYEKKLWNSLLASKEISEMKTKFLATVSHELRTPLNSIIGFANILIKNDQYPAADGDKNFFLHKILNSGKYLLSLVNDILDLSSAETGRVEIQWVETQIGPLIDETIREVEGLVIDKNIHLVAEAPAVLAPLKTDPRKFKQILINLVANACKFTDQGHIKLRVSAHPDTHAPFKIDIEDTGIGIPEEQREFIFEAFRQGRGGLERGRGGAGLGLAIVRSYCNLLGYSIELKSKVGKGSTFSIILANKTASLRDPITI